MRHNPARTPTADRRAIAAAIASLLAAAALASCGGSSSDPALSGSPAQILTASRTAATHASAVHIQTTASQGPLTLNTDLQLSNTGGRAKLKFERLSYEVIRIANTIYLKGTPGLYRRLLAGNHVQVPSDVWLEGSATTGSLARYTPLTSLPVQLDRQLTGGPFTKGTTTAINGQKAIELKETGKLFSGSLAIAATGKPYPIQIIKHGRETGRTTFSGWNQPAALSAPPDAIALSTLEHGGR